MTIRSSVLTFTAASLLTACRGSSHESAPHSAIPPNVAIHDAAAAVEESARPVPNGCAKADELIYLVGSPPDDGRDTGLFRFDPKKGTTSRMAKLACTPFSIAIDRNGVMWAIDHEHHLLTIDVGDGRCKKTPFTPNQHGFEQVYLAFVADPTAKGGEILYASDEHYSHGDPTESRGLATIDQATLRLTPVGPFDHQGPFDKKPCSIVGTGDGRLFAQCSGPELWSVTRTLAGNRLPLSPVAGDTSSLNRLHPRPFAFWGGSLWVFAHPCDGGACTGGSRFTRFDLAAGQSSVQQDDGLPVIVSAAATSTCAPL